MHTTQLREGNVLNGDKQNHRLAMLTPTTITIYRQHGGYCGNEHVHRFSHTRAPSARASSHKQEASAEYVAVSVDGITVMVEAELVDHQPVHTDGNGWM